MIPATEIIALLLATGPPLPQGPTAGAPLLAAAAALAVGEPKRALRLLDGAGGQREDGAAAAALRLAAHTLDLNRYPGQGGAVMSWEETRSAAGPVPEPSTPEAALVVLAAARLVPVLQSARDIAANSGIAGDPQAAGQAVELLRQLSGDIEASGSPALSVYHRVATADVARRAGRTEEAARLLESCRPLVRGDALAGAHLLLAEGDLALEPESHPELLGLRLAEAPGLPALSPAGDPLAAEVHYARAEALYVRVGAGLGGAETALRRAHVARRRGDAVARDRFAEEARRRAALAGGGALTWLVEFQHALDRLGDGEQVPDSTLDAVTGWTVRDGSTSFTRGLLRLVVARCRAWREEGATLPALRALRLARRIAAGTDAPAESGIVDAAHVDIVGGANYGRAPAVLLAADTAHAVSELRRAPAGVLDWTRAALLAMRFDQAAETLADPELKAIAAARLTEIEAVGATLADRAQDAVGQVAEAVRESARRARTLLLRYRGRRAESAGFRDEARVLLLRALALAEEQQDAMLRAVLLSELGRRPEARALAGRLFEAGGLHPDHAVSLFLAVRDPLAAQRAQSALDASGPPGETERPWEDPARRAELYEALGDHAAAARTAERAVDLFEHRTAQLVRDALRSSATDHPLVAGMYHTAVLAHLGLAARTTGYRARAELAAAFELADRCRGIAAGVVRSLDTLPAGAPTAAARRWLRAGSAWSATYEGLVDEVSADPERTPSSVALRRRVLAAEDTLDGAESEVARLAPQLLAHRRLAQPDAGVAEIQRALPADSALLLYETLDDELIVWTVGRRTIRCHRAPVRARDLACDVRHFHTACAAGRDDERGAAELSELLLAPATRRLDACGRLFVVPHGALSLLPFHALPVRGGLLGERFTVSYLPSAGLLTRAGAGGRPRLDGTALVVGDPAYAPHRGLPRLPGTATEAATVARLLGTEPLLRSAATAQAVAEAAPGRPVLHLATHGVLYERGPNRSFVALAGHDRLAVGDLLGLDLNADLVVLSACHTGRGTATAGGDLVGLARAAVASGARHVVVSLWPVDDETGCLLMAALYEGLVSGLGVSDALAAAQRRIRRLDAAGRQRAYARLRDRAGTEAAAPGPRDGRVPAAAARAARPEGPYHWAPFIHIGGADGLRAADGREPGRTGLHDTSPGDRHD
ncbi:CHAT domain-containing protein [Streptomyces rimosus]|uniref:CHAT domain-containing protein n=1 Tax=Streptomyces rimosus TaxID=1927 RepID=UPI00379E8ADF